MEDCFEQVERVFPYSKNVRIDGDRMVDSLKACAADRVKFRNEFRRLERDMNTPAIEVVSFQGSKEVLEIMRPGVGSDSDRFHGHGISRDDVERECQIFCVRLP